MIVIEGAGSVGLVMGARLAASGTPILFLTRSEADARSIERDGLVVEELPSGKLTEAQALATSDPGRALEAAGSDPILFCTRASQLPIVAQELAQEPAAASAVCWQNDVSSEPILAQHFDRVVGGVVRLTSTRTSPRSAVSAGTGRLILGDYPNGLGSQTEVLADKLRRAHYDVGLSTTISQDKWLKLCINLMSTPNALIVRSDHTTQAFVDVKKQLLEEARTVLAAAGIAASSCDGRDRSLDEEVYNQVWSALTHGGPVEADGYHRRIIGLAQQHDIPTPTNQRVLDVLLEAIRTSSGPESSRAVEFLD